MKKIKKFPSYIFTAPYPKEGMVLWAVAKIQCRAKVYATEALVNEWIGKRPTDEQKWYLPIPIILGKKISPKKKKDKH